ncbi:MAG: tRNA (adenosine(37)-N6)-threonylcarbamoyltransferase complex dimerization subunit type 1 TsaB [Planctomycetes bacterium]|nr:tRNA (adenosine(37)-N6)-threonylcarbamoyltransferase complex dimerization subunit type 1 TsaB [Planctomycetota bacterium]
MSPRDYLDGGGASGSSGSSGAPAAASAILAIETSHAQGSVAVGERATSTPYLAMFSPGLVHAREIMTTIDHAFAETKLPRSAIALVAVSAGPGSYTGVRIGVAAAKAIAYALRIPALALSTLEIIARNVTADGEFAVLLDARRGACYAARFARRAGALVRLTLDRVFAPDDFFSELPPSCALLGEGVAAFPAGAARFRRLPEEWDLPRADRALEAARGDWERIERAEEPPPAEFSNPHLLVPFYLRDTEAEEKAEARAPKGGR